MTSRHLFRGHRFSETNVHAPARSQKFGKTAVALSMLGLLPIEIVERALLDKGPDMILILAKAAGCTWTTTKAMLAMNAADRGLSKQEMAEAQNPTSGSAAKRRGVWSISTSGGAGSPPRRTPS